jgi:hypothetical protein
VSRRQNSEIISELNKRNAIGIIDNDYLLIGEKQVLRKQHIMALPYNEVENCFIDEACYSNQTRT